MRDVVMLAVIAAFFALCVAYVWWCDHIIGPDTEALDAESTTAERVRAEHAEVSA